jgi:hypothetical protein
MSTALYPQLTSVLLAVEDYEQYMLQDRVNLVEQLPGKIARIDKAVQLFLKAFLSSRVPPDAFIDATKGLLNRIHIVMMDRTFKDLYLRRSTDTKSTTLLELESKLRSVHDRFFNALGIKRPALKFASLPTQICTEFLKGITVFDSNASINETPFYHRPNSCGTKELPTEAKFAPLSTNTDVTRQQKKQHVKTCYVERLVYDHTAAVIKLWDTQ